MASSLRFAATIDRSGGGGGGGRRRIWGVSREGGKGERVSFFAVLLHGSPEVAICWSLRCQRPEVGPSLFVPRRSTPARSICNGETRERGCPLFLSFFFWNDPFSPNARKPFVFYWQCSIKDITAKWKSGSHVMALPSFFFFFFKKRL